MTWLTADAIIPMVVLGALHGVNPAMGWLFAVGLGLQERRRGAVWRALPPLAVGHAVAVAAAVALALALGELIPQTPLRWGVAITLGAFGVYRLFRHAHPRYGGMRVTARQLATWSFLMATAHGAGLMVVPFAGRAAAGAGHYHGAHHGAHHGDAVAAGAPLAGLGGESLAGLWMTLAHTAGYLVVAGLLAALVYERLGVRVLRAAWINLDLVWSVALLATAVATVVW
jgi:hypothetical protein